MPTADLDGIRIHYEQLGRGPDVVMVHGLGANLAFWALRIAPRLAARWRVTLYDLRGHGYSDMPPRGYGPSDMAGDLARLVDHLELERPHLVGHSFGGAIVLEHARRAPDRVASLTLADPVAGALLPTSTRGRARARYLRDRIDELTTGPRLVPLAGAAAGVRGATSGWPALASRTSAPDEIVNGDHARLRELRTIDCPVLAVYGGRSRYLGARPRLERALPQTRTVIVPGVGHFHPLLRPDAFVDEVAPFVSSVRSNGDARSV